MTDRIFSTKDILFRDETNCIEGAWLKTPAPKLSSFADGYEIIILNIFKLFKNDKNNNIIVYPIVYIAMHYIELRIKELYALGRHYLDKTKPKIKIDNFPNGHQIPEIWLKYTNDILRNIKEIQNDDTTDITRILEEFNVEDKTGQSFRYPFDNSAQRTNLIKRETLDLKNFESIIMKINKYFNWHSETLYALIDTY
ncbi:MAG: hypothetical protein HQ554_04845 [FCB group bacterium]|nr:hypothetical protein [FCB group bacterium]